MEFAIKNTYKVTHRAGSTNDIISVVMHAYEIENDGQIKTLATELKGENDYQTIQNIFDFLIKKVIYVADIGTQEVRTPARLLHDKQGDCKSYSLFVCTVLRYLGIDCFFRFVSYSNEKEATHVYPCAVINNEIIPIDAVAFIQRSTSLGPEIPYKYKCDMQNATTKIAYLAGIGNSRSKIGNVLSDSEARDPYWLQRADDDTVTNAKLWLVSQWDLQWMQAQYPDNLTQYLNSLNALEYTALAIRGYMQFYLRDAELADFFTRLSLCEYYRVFDTDDANIDDRDYYSDEKFYYVLNNEDFNLRQYVPTFNKWNENVLKQNIRIAGISGASAAEMQQKLTDSGAYYIYAYGISSDNLNKYNSTVRNKRGFQLDICDTYIKPQIGVSYQIVNNWHITGCTSAFGASPAKSCESMRVNGIQGIGIATEAVLAIIGTIIGLIGTIVSWFAQKPSQSSINAGAMASGDFPELNSGGGDLTSGLSISSFWPVLFIGGVGLFLSTKKKKKHRK
ncbi:MAG: transglutaminase-like domain-containing protein [Prevotellaceae bacterium]|jgi:hypothetical protein|nr:transglutaminase-like domain-containing protein [Prevotellaceae bacterium]